MFLLLSQSCPFLSCLDVADDVTLLVDLTLPRPQIRLELCQGVFSVLIVDFGEILMVVLMVVLVERPIDDVRCEVIRVAVASRQPYALCTTIAPFFVVVINVMKCSLLEIVSFFCRWNSKGLTLSLLDDPGLAQLRWQAC